MKTRLVAALLAAAALPAAAFAANPSPAKTAPGFTRPDANQDGYLSRAEAEAAADARFARLDVNNDGKLAPGEHPEWRARGAHPRLRRAMQMRGIGPTAFAEYDFNKDGALELNEFRAHALKLFDAQDGNGDRMVKLPQWRAPKG